MSTSPVAVYRTFCEVAFEAATVVVEHRELVLTQNVAVWVGVDVCPDVVHSVVEVGRNTRVQVAFGIASYIDGSLVVKGTYSVNVGRVVASHDAARGSRDGCSVGM